MPAYLVKVFSMWVFREQTIQRPRGFDRVPGPRVKAVLEGRFVSLTRVELGAGNHSARVLVRRSTGFSVASCEKKTGERPI